MKKEKNKNGVNGTQALMPVRKDLSLPAPCTPTNTALIIDESITEQQFLKVGRALKTMDSCVQFWLGDWKNFAESNENFQNNGTLWTGKKIYKPGTLNNVAWVCRRLEPSRRRENLTFGHHQVIASFEDKKEQEKWLDCAVENELSVMKLRGRIKEYKVQKKVDDFYTNKHLYIIVSGTDKIIYEPDAIAECSRLFDVISKGLAQLLDHRLKKNPELLKPEQFTSPEKVLIKQCKGTIEYIQFFLDEVVKTVDVCKKEKGEYLTFGNAEELKFKQKSK